MPPSIYHGTEVSCAHQLASYFKIRENTVIMMIPFQFECNSYVTPREVAECNTVQAVESRRMLSRCHAEPDREIVPIFISRVQVQLLTPGGGLGIHCKLFEKIVMFWGFAIISE